MARTAISVQSIPITGIDPTFVAATVTDGNSFLNGDGVFLIVKNGSGSPITVTLQTPATLGGVAVSDPTVSVPATTGQRFIGPFNPQAFNQADGSVYVDFSSVTSVTIAAVQCP